MDLAETAIERITVTAASQPQTTAERPAAFSPLMRYKLETGDIAARKAYLHAEVSRIEPGDDENPNY